MEREFDFAGYSQSNTPQGSNSPAQSRRHPDQRGDHQQVNRQGDYNSTVDRNNYINTGLRMAPVPSQMAHEDDEGNSGASLFDMYIHKYRRYIDLIDQLRSIGLEKELPLPQVVVLGVQSSGKSSVLEAISGISLPRGTGIVTRCPLELRLKYTRNPTEWKCTLSCQPPGTRQPHTAEILTPNEVSSQVLGAQALLTQNTSISTTPITLEITSPDVPDLTLIDLPGITEVAFGNEDASIVEQIKGLANSYIRRKDTLILVVAACNADLATTRALRMANEVDKDGERTIGVVLTKVDLVDKGAEKEIVRIMMNPVLYKVKKGFTLVKLRSQQAIDAGQTREEAEKQEQEFFASKSQYKNLKQSDLGIRHLARKLKDQLVQRIQNSLPELKEAVVNKLDATEHQLKLLGNDIPREGPAREKAFRDLMDGFKEIVRKVCEGSYDNEIRPELRLLYHTRFKVESFAGDMATKLPDVGDRDFQESTRREVEQTRGMALPGFLPYQACRNIIQQRIELLKGPVEELLREINGQVDKTLRTVSEEQFQSYPTLANQVRFILDESRKKAYTECLSDIEDLFKIESLIYVPDSLFTKYESLMNLTRVPRGRDQQNAAQVHQADNQQRAGTAGRPERASVSVDQQQYEQQQQQQYQQQLARQHRPSNDVQLVLKQITTYIQLAIDRLTGVVPMRVHHHLITKLYITIRSRMTELGSDYERMNNLTEDDYTRQAIENLVIRKECLEKSYEELSGF